MLSRVRITLIYVWRHHRWPELSRPRRFTEWVQWRKLNDRDPDRARLTDKLHGKALAATALGKEMMIPTLWQGDKLPAVAPWPMPFVVKANHGCGHYVVVRAPADYALARRRSVHWLRKTYGSWLDEWHYRSARRMILVEPFVGTSDALPPDYKVYVFGGRAAMVQLHEERGGNHRWSQYDLDWRGLSSGASDAAPPASLAAMIVAAKRLGAGHDFVRVDFYEVEGRALFGEFCLFPGSGLDRFNPVTLDDWLGEQWSAQYAPERPAPRKHGDTVQVTG